MKAVIFDMDGVLADSGPIHEWAFQETLRPYGVFVDYRRIAGMRTRDAMEALLAGHGAAADAAQLAAAKSRTALQRMREENPAVPGAFDVVERLSARLPVALASSGSRESVAAFLEMNHAGPLFRAVLSGDDIGAAKPAPDIYVEAARRLGLSPPDCLVVEDSAAGAQAGRAAGAEVMMMEPSIDSLSRLLEGGVSAPAILTADEIMALASGPRDREQWTAIIPAAGRGTRLGFHLPKILYPVAGRTILEWLARLLDPVCSRVIVVAAPDGAAVISRELEKLLPGRSEVAMQAQPTGMADAIEAALSSLRTRHALIVWGDQAAIEPESLDLCVRLHEGAAALATVPTSLRANPYIHFERDGGGRLVRVLQAREGDRMPSAGESDSGVFLFRSIALRRFLAELKRGGSGIGRNTKEFNFLPVLPLVARLPGSLLTPRIMREQESIGVNSSQDAERLSQALRDRGGAKP